MRGEASSNVLKVWVYAGASVLLGTWLTPLFYNAGKALAEVVDNGKQTNGPLEWLAGICRVADFPEFFEAALFLSGLFLFFPFVEWMRGGRPPAGSGRTWAYRLPLGSRGSSGGQPLEKNPHRIRQFFTGFGSVTLLFTLIAAILLLSGVFTWNASASALTGVIWKTAVIALALAVLQEFIFRGIAMGVFLRAMGPTAALGMSALLFALVHFLSPPSGMGVLDPEASGVGFELLTKIFAQFSKPLVLIGALCPLVALGSILAYARWKTASLWLPMGIHTGYLFTTDLLQATSTFGAPHDSILWLLFGNSLNQGLVALAGILIAGLFTIHLVPRHDAVSSPS